jgi:hypothetical protein
MDAMSFSSMSRCNPSRPEKLVPLTPKLYYGDPRNYGSRLESDYEQPLGLNDSFGGRVKPEKRHLQTPVEEDDDHSSVQSDLYNGRMNQQQISNLNPLRGRTEIPGNSVHKAKKESVFKRCSTHQEGRP